MWEVNGRKPKLVFLESLSLGQQHMSTPDVAVPSWSYLVWMQLVQSLV